jgi:putative transposase
MIRTYKYLLRPTPQQAQDLDFLLWQSRLIYNAALEQRITTYRETGKGTTYLKQGSSSGMFVVQIQEQLAS